MLCSSVVGPLDEVNHLSLDTNYVHDNVDVRTFGPSDPCLKPQQLVLLDAVPLLLPPLT
jgi:hypothetical protein